MKSTNQNNIEANLKVYFCLFQEITLYTHFNIDNYTYSTKQNIDIKLKFNDFEIELGKKICFIELFYIKDGTKLSKTSYIEIYPGNNIAYCFLDVNGTTFEIIFYRKEINKFLNNNNFSISSKDYNMKIPITLNSMNLNDRANLILINCLNMTTIQSYDNDIINLGKMSSKINDFSFDNSYMLFIDRNDYEEIKYRELKPLNQLTFAELYNNNKIKVEEMYNELISSITNNPNTFIENYKKNIYEKYKYLIDIMYNNYVLPKSILKKELNNNEYLDFIFKIVVFSYLEKKLNGNSIFNLENLKDLIYKLNVNYNYIKKDKDIEIYDKILLLINVFLSDLFDYDDEIKYFNLAKINKESPLFLAIEFLKEFIKEFDYESNFYYPLLLIDGGLFYYKYKEDLISPVWVTTFGANMNTLEVIKAHLRNLIPNVVLYSNNFKTDDYSFVMPQIGIVTLNLQLIGNDCDKKIIDDKIRNHKAFVISKVFFHEIYGHVKSSFSKDYKGKGKYILSPICFKDEKDGTIRFLPDENNDNLYKDIKQVSYEDLKASNGDSGYLLEFYFGEINGEYVLEIIDDIENITNLGVLLNTKLWHKQIDLFKEYIVLKKYLIDQKLIGTINENNKIEEQIYEMQKIIGEKMDTIKEQNYIKIGTKIQNNFFKDNKIELNKIKKKKSKNKSFENDKHGKNKKTISIASLVEEAFNPFDPQKVFKLSSLFPNLFRKK